MTRRSSNGNHTGRVTRRVSGSSDLVKVSRAAIDSALLTSAAPPSVPFPQALIDALSANIAVLDEHGVIIAVNAPWRRFIASVGDIDSGHRVGDDYLDRLAQFAAEDTPGAHELLAGIRSVTSGAAARFTGDYPLVLAHETQWFVTSVAPLDGSYPGAVVISFENVSSLTRSEHERERLLGDLTERVKELTAIHGVVEALSRPDRTIADRLREIVHMVPGAMLYPSLARARIIIADTIADTHPDDPKDANLPTMQSTFSTGAGNMGVVEVSYVVSHWESNDPFLPEERVLLESIGGMIGAHLQRADALDELHQRQRRFRSLVQNATDIVAIVDIDGSLTYASPSFDSILGYDPAALIGVNAFTLLHPDDVEPASISFQQRSDDPTFNQTDQIRLRHADGSMRWVEATGRNMLADPVINGIVVNARDITERTQQDERQRLLATISDVLSESLDLETTFQRLVQQLVPAIADWCTVNILESDDSIRRVAIAHADPALSAQVDKLADYPLDMRSDRGMPHTIRTGQPVFTPVVPEDFWAPTQSAEYIRLHGELGVRSFASVPMIARGRILGAIGLVYGHSGRNYTANDLLLAQEIARRAAIAIDNAQFYQASRDAEASYRTLVEQIPATMYRAPIGTDGELYLSPQIEGLLGYTTEEWKASATLRWDAVHPDDRERFQAELVSSDASLDRSSIEYRYIGKHGNAVWVRNTAQVVRDEAGQPLYWQGFMTDISVQKAAEIALMEVMSLQDTLIEASPLAIISLDLDHNVISWNAKAEEVFGWSEHEVMGRFNPTIGASQISGYLDLRENLLRNGGTISRERTAPTKDGRMIDISIAAAPLHKPDGSVYGTVVMIEDVTESNRAAERIRFQARLLDSVEQAVIATNNRGSVQYWNHFAEELYGWTAAEATGRSIVTLTDPDIPRDRARAMIRQLRAGTSLAGEFNVQHKSGRRFWVHLSDTPFIDDAGAVAGVIGVSFDISERRAAEEALRDSEARFRSAFDDASVGMAIFSLDRTITSVNPALCRMLGYEASEIVGKTGQDFSFLEDGDAIAPYIQDVVDGKAPAFQVEKRYRHRDGSTIWAIVSSTVVGDSTGEPLYMVTQFQDITARQSLEERLLHQTLHDSLTGLPNRTLLMDRLDRATTAARRHGATVAILFVDLDNFKLINDSLGHSVGDGVLVSIAERLRDCVREEDTIARFGGDEFVVMLGRIDGANEAIEVAERILTSMHDPVSIQGRDVVISPSIGIALSVRGQHGRDELVRQADIAMYRAKLSGKSSFNLFDAAMHDQALLRLELEHDLRLALEGQEFQLVFQPVISISTGQVSGLEALIRWEHPERGLVGPDDFIPVAEETGLIVPIGEWVLREACRQAASWQASGPLGRPFLIGVNLSARQFRQPGLVQQVEAALIDSDLPPERLILELTESILMEHASAAVERLQELAALGVQIAIDDFGTGYSSLAYLKRFPVAILKIDRSFVNGIGVDAESAAIVSATVGLAHTLGMKIVGEGVETIEQLTVLRNLGCDYGQGFFFSRPIPAAQIESYLRMAG